MSAASDKKICPECGHVFQGNGWDGIDAHWRSKHENVMRYEDVWPLIKSGQYPPDLETQRLATCRCGQLRVTCKGEPVRVSVCHCFACQQRSGSAFAVQARWPDELVHVEGDTKTWVRTADSGNKATYPFCPACGTTLAYSIENWPGVTAVPVGNFTDLDFPVPKFSVYEDRKHAWVEILGEGVDHTTSTNAARKPGLDLLGKR